MAPDEALKANIKIIEAISKQGGKVYLSHPMTRKEIAPAATDIGRNLDINIIARANGSNYQEILKDHLSLDDYADEMIKKCYGKWRRSCCNEQRKYRVITKQR